MEDITTDLRQRGLLGFVDDEGYLKELKNRKVTVYIGFDPTGRSLHVGHLLPMMMLLRFQNAGHKAIALMGGGTGLIGDPSGKSEERNLLDHAALEENVNRIRHQITSFLDSNSNTGSYIVANNIDWISELSFVDFLRTVGKHFRVNEMVQKESVKKRMEGDTGISLTEFCYQTLQAYDFYQLNKLHDCELQAGGMDQWGNIAAGIDLVRRLGGPRVHGICFPLMTKSDGSKFGKTESGAVWLDPEMTSPFEFYQFWVRTDDKDVVKYLKQFTLLDISRIAELEKALEEQPEQRLAHKTLAYEMTSMVHNHDEAEKAKAASEKLYSGDIKGATDEQIMTIFPDVPSTDVPRADLDEGVSLVDLLALSGLCKSKGDAKRQVKGGGIYLNNERCSEVEKVIYVQDLASDNFLILRRGKKNYHLVKFN